MAVIDNRETKYINSTEVHAVDDTVRTRGCAEMSIVYCDTCSATDRTTQRGHRCNNRSIAIVKELHSGKATKFGYHRNIHFARSVRWAETGNLDLIHHSETGAINIIKGYLRCVRKVGSIDGCYKRASLGQALIRLDAVS